MIQTDTSTPGVTTPDGTTIERVLRPLARKAGGMTGADIRELVQNARRNARREKRPVTYGDIESLLAGSRQTRSAPLCWRMAVHEAGHAIARLYFQLGPIIEITIEARDGGYVLGAFSQKEQTEELLTVYLIAHLAGRAAEEEIFGSATSNSGGSEQSDLALATGLAQMAAALSQAQGRLGNFWHRPGTRPTRAYSAYKRPQGRSRHRPQAEDRASVPREYPPRTGNAGRTGTGRRA